MSKTLHVLTREVHIGIHEVKFDDDADATPENAIRCVDEGKGNVECVTVEFSHFRPKAEWTVEDEDGEILKEQE